MKQKIFYKRLINFLRIIYCRISHMLAESSNNKIMNLIYPKSIGTLYLKTNLTNHWIFL